MHRYSNRIAAILAMSTFSQEMKELSVGLMISEYQNEVKIIHKDIYYVLALESFDDIELNRKNIMCTYIQFTCVVLYLYTQNGIFF